MAEYWRISNHLDLTGQGGRHGSARWHTAGRPIVYLADHAASAMLEVLVHLKSRNDRVPRTFQLIRIGHSDDLVCTTLLPPLIPDWQDHPEFTREIGDQWLRAGNSSLACVPSAIVPHTSNYLLNPLHPEAAQLQILSSSRERFDNRLFQFGSR